MQDLFVWLVLWFSIWGLFNFLYSGKYLKKLNNEVFLARGIYFALSFLLIYLIFNRYLVHHIWLMLAGLFICNIIGFVLGNNKHFYKQFASDRYFLIFQSFNILFQSAMILSGIKVIQNLLQVSYRDYYFGLLFMAVHIPIVFFPWIKLRYRYVLFAFLAGFVFSYLITNIYLGLLISYLIHYLGYILLLNSLKSADKV